MTDPWAPLRDLERQLRDYINEPRVQHQLMKDQVVWMQVCSSLDVIGDTTVALSASQVNEEINLTEGGLYLFIYGLLQALYLQQDALVTLCGALGVPLGHDEFRDQFPRLWEIRQLRNDATGHPTKRLDGSTHFIARYSVARSGFLLMSYYADGSRNQRHIDLQLAIRDQRFLFSEAMKRVRNELEVKMKAHKDQFKDEKLADIFHATWEYYIEKLVEAASGADRGRALYAQASHDGLERMLNNFRSALEKRGISVDAYPGIQLAYRETVYPLEQISVFLEEVAEGGDSQVDARAVYIFAWYLREKIRELAGMAEEIDKDYDS